VRTPIAPQEQGGRAEDDPGAGLARQCPELFPSDLRGLASLGQQRDPRRSGGHQHTEDDERWNKKDLLEQIENGDALGRGRTCLQRSVSLYRGALEAFMPIYEYRCPGCGTEFEKMQRISDAPPDCPQCGHTEVVKKVSASSFVLKGSGWYKDHYGLKKGAGGGEGASSGGASDSGGSSKSGETAAAGGKSTSGDSGSSGSSTSSGGSTSSSD
jgi:putative FmdB family regulatory protein